MPIDCLFHSLRLMNTTERLCCQLQYNLCKLLLCMWMEIRKLQRYCLLLFLIRLWYILHFDKILLRWTELPPLHTHTSSWWRSEIKNDQCYYKVMTKICFHSSAFNNIVKVWCIDEAALPFDFLKSLTTAVPELQDCPFCSHEVISHQMQSRIRVIFLWKKLLGEEGISNIQQASPKNNVLPPLPSINF